MSHLDYPLTTIRQMTVGLNPCCNGCRTWTQLTGLPISLTNLYVLILVVMDVALGHRNQVKDNQYTDRS